MAFMVNLTWAQLAAAGSIFLIVMGAFARYVDKRFDAFEKRFEDFHKSVNQRFETFEKTINQRFETFEKAMSQRFDDFQKAIETRFDDQKDWIRAELRVHEEHLERVEHPVRRS
jgi:hypothetical protein